LSSKEFAKEFGSCLHGSAAQQPDQQIRGCVEVMLMGRWSFFYTTNGNVLVGLPMFFIVFFFQPSRNKGRINNPNWQLATRNWQERKSGLPWLSTKAIPYYSI
jgi:hypothetical protein